MSSADNRRPGPPRQQSPRREPLFPLESEDIAPRERRGPPSPLRDLVGDIDAEMPTRVDMPRREAARPAAPPLSRPDPPAAQRQVPQAAGAPAAQRVKTQARSSARPQPRPMLVAEPEDNLIRAQIRHDESEASLRRTEMFTAQPYRRYSAPRTPPLPSLNRWLVMGVVLLASLVVLVSMGGPSGAALSRWGAAIRQSTNSVANGARPQLFTAARAAGDYALQGGPSLTAQQIDTILAAYGSPAVGTGAAWYNLGLKYGIDPAFALAFFIHESSAGTNSGWAGIKPGGATTHNVGNIICAGYATCYGRFRDYASWDEGIDDWYKLIDVEYIQGRGTKTVQDIIPIYAPSFENDVQAYINSVTSMIDGWRTDGVN